MIYYVKTKSNAQIFKQALSDVYFYYTGHSGKDGKWSIDLDYT